MAEILNPHDADLESVILGACLAESTAMVLVSGKLCPEMFYEAKYGEIFAALLAMHRAGKAIDIITVRGRNRQTLWGGCTDANPKLLLNDT